MAFKRIFIHQQINKLERESKKKEEEEDTSDIDIHRTNYFRTHDKQKPIDACAIEEEEEEDENEDAVEDKKEEYCDDEKRSLRIKIKLRGL